MTAIAAIDKYDDIGASQQTRIVSLSAGMSSREIVSSIQDALDYVDARGGGLVDVIPDIGVTTIIFDDWLEVGSYTTLRFPPQLIITRTAHDRNVPNMTCTISSQAITAINVLSQPGGYHKAPKVFITGSQMETATIYAYIDASVNGGSVTACYIKNGGTGYHSAPTYAEIEGTPRSDLTGTSLARRPTLTFSVSGGQVTGFTIVDGGKNLKYTGWTPVRVHGGRHCRATANLDNNGNLTSVTINNGGINYVTIRPFQTLGTGSTVIACGGNRHNVCPLVTNKDWWNGNRHIKIIGGIWDGNVGQIDYAYTNFEYNGMCFQMCSVDHVEIRVSGFQNFYRYTGHFQNCWDVTIGRHFSYNGFDDCHLTGHNRWVHHEGVYGTTSDDMFTCTALGRTDDLEAGDIEHVYCQGFDMSGTTFALAVWGGLRQDGSSYTLDNIHYTGIRGMSLNQLLRVSCVEQLVTTGIGHIRFDDVEIVGQSTFTAGATYPAPARSLIVVNWISVDKLDIELRHVIRESSNTVTPTILEVNLSGSVRECNVKLDVDWNCAATANLIYFTAGANSAPEKVRISGNVRCAADSGNSTYIAYFNGATKCPTQFLDLSDLVTKNIQVAAGLTASSNTLFLNRAYIYRANGSSGAISYDNTLNALVSGVVMDGGGTTSYLFVGASASAKLYWNGLNTQMLNSGKAHQSNGNASMFPKDWSLVISLTHTANTERIQKEGGCYLRQATTNGAQYGIPTEEMLVCDRDYDGNLWWMALGSGSRAMVATIVSGGTGYTANDILTIATGTWRKPPQIKVLTVSGGVIQTVSVLYSGAWDQARSTGTLSVTGGTGASATFTLAPL